MHFVEINVKKKCCSFVILDLWPHPNLETSTKQLIHVLLIFLVIVKAAPHECVNRTKSTLDMGKSLK